MVVNCYNADLDELTKDLNELQNSKEELDGVDSVTFVGDSMYGWWNDEFLGWFNSIIDFITNFQQISQ